MFGPLTPAKMITLALLLAGLAALLPLRLISDADGGLLTGVGITLIGFSFLTDALLPGASDLTPEQEMMLREAGVTASIPTLRKFGAAAGMALTLLGLYLVSANR